MARRQSVTKIKALGYLRVSGKAQVEGDGFTRQREAIERFARSHGYELVEWFEDGGVSGASELDDRPGLMEAMERIAGNGVRHVIVEAEHRLARELMVQEAILKAFRDAGAHVLTADGHDLTDDDDPARVLMRQIFGAVAQYEKRILVAKLRSARGRQRAAEGKCEGVKRYGETSDDERRVIARMRELRIPASGSRGSYASIARTLNAEGLTNRAGRPWSARLVQHVMVTA